MQHKRQQKRPQTNSTLVYELSEAIDISKELRNSFRNEAPSIRVTDMMRTQCMWVRFNMLSDVLDQMAREPNGLKNGIGVSEHNDLCWAIINRLLNLPRSEYDFNAFNPIHSMGDFKDAMEHCWSCSVSGIWVRKRCTVCGQLFGMEYSVVQELQKRGSTLPICCENCGGREYVMRRMLLRPQMFYNTFTPYQRYNHQARNHRTGGYRFTGAR